MVNDCLFAIGGCKELGTVGEKYTLSENKWREIKSKNSNEHQ